MATQLLDKPKSRRWQVALFASSLILALVVDAALPAGALDDGAYDTSYGSSGAASVTSGNAKHIAVDSQNRAVVVGGKFVSGSSCTPYIARFTPGGVMDTTFGSGSVGWTEITPAISCADTDNASVVIGPSDSVFITTHTNTDFGVRKFTSAGIPDLTWGTDGLVTTDFGADDYPRAAALSGTNLIVVGKSYDGTLSVGYDKPAAALYGPTGQLVSTFGTQGKVKIDVSSVADSEWFDDVAVYNDGKFTIVGTYGANNTDPGGNRLPFLVRLNTDGSLDPTFNPIGSVPDGVAGVRLVTEAEVPSGCRCAGEKLVVLDAANSSTSRIAIAGSHRDPSTSLDNIYVEEFNADGSLNTVFGTNGVKKLNVPNSKAAYVGGMVLDGSNLVVAGRPITNDANFMARLDAATGDFDTTFVASGSTLGWSLGTLGPSFDLAVDGYGRYLVAAASPDGTITPSQILAYYGTYDVPGVPTGLAATAGDRQVVLSWSAPTSTGGASITDYVVELSSDSGSTWSTFADGTLSSTGTTVTGLTNGTPYTFRASATNSAGTGTASPTATATPATVTDAPTIGAVSSVTATSVSVAWTAPANTGGASITDYVIDYSSDNGSTWSTFVHSALTVSPVVVDGLLPATAYMFKVAAHNSAGDSNPSGTVTATTSAAVPGVPTIGAVSSVTATSVSVAWTAPASDGGAAITSYTVTPSPACSACTGLSVSGAPAVSPATVTGLSPGTAYTFTVTAHNSAGDSNPSNPSASATTNAAVPGAPTIGVVSSVTVSSVSVAWTAPASDGGAAITDYKIEYSSDSGSTWLTFVHSASTVSPVVVDGLSPATAYTFKIAAHNSVGDGASSGTVTTTTSTAVPGAPTIGVVSSVTVSSVSVAWTAPTSDGGATITSYTVTPSPACSVCTGLSVSGTPAVSPATVTGLSPATAYTFTVTAHNTAGDGQASGTVTATTSAAVPTVSVPGSPSGVTGVVGDAQVVVSWVAPSSTGGSGIVGYTVTASPGGATCVSQTISCTVSGLTNDTAYTFSVHATNSAGDSTESASSAPVTPEAPSNPAPAASGCPAGTSTGFTDIGGSFARTDIGCMEELGITTGMSATTFDPKGVVTREQMATFLARTWRSLGGTCQSSIATPFRDFEGSSAKDDIGCIWSLGITRGTSANTFDPTAAVTREQMATFLARLWRALGRTFPADVSIPFADIGDSFAKADIGHIRSLGITTGTSATTFDPTGAVTLEQMAAFLARTIRVFAA